jgi:hypothetical protein
VYVYGLFLDGCAWSGRENKLVDLEPKNSTTHCLCFTSRGFKPRCGTMYRDTGVRFVACGMRTTKLQMSLLMRRINPLTCY